MLTTRSGFFSSKSQLLLEAKFKITLWPQTGVTKEATLRELIDVSQSLCFSKTSSEWCLALQLYRLHQIHFHFCFLSCCDLWFKKLIISLSACHQYFLFCENRARVNCPHDFHLSVKDLDGDKVRCRFASSDKGECVSCTQHSFIELDGVSCISRVQGFIIVGTKIYFILN